MWVYTSQILCCCSLPGLVCGTRAFPGLGGASGAFRDTLIGWGKLYIKPNPAVTCSSPGIFHIPRCTCVSICACACFHKCVCVCVFVWLLPHTADTYISCWVRCSLSFFIVWKPTLECFSSSFITVQTHRMEFTWHNEDAVKAYKSLPAYNAGSKPGLSPEAVTHHDLEKERGRGEKRHRQVQQAEFSVTLLLHTRAKEKPYTKWNYLWEWQDWTGKQNKSRRERTTEEKTEVPDRNMRAPQTSGDEKE